MKYILSHDRNMVLEAIRSATDGHSVEIKPPTRSGEQNRLYWAEMNKLADKHGQTAEVWHCFFRQMFIQPQVVELQGNVVFLPPSTTKLTKTEFSEYLESVFSWIAQNVPE